ncbi:IP5P13 [Scenedesmus sp. PABB004]|nr:IP5P13 [Scenedesmus sp. PABB004]
MSNPFEQDGGWDPFGAPPQQPAAPKAPSPGGLRPARAAPAPPRPPAPAAAGANPFGALGGGAAADDDPFGLFSAAADGGASSAPPPPPSYESLMGGGGGGAPGPPPPAYDAASALPPPPAYDAALQLGGEQPAALRPSRAPPPDPSGRGPLHAGLPGPSRPAPPAPVPARPAPPAPVPARAAPPPPGARQLQQQLAGVQLSAPPSPAGSSFASGGGGGAGLGSSYASCGNVGAAPKGAVSGGQDAAVQELNAQIRLPPLNPKAAAPLKLLAAGLGSLFAGPAGDAGQLLQWTPSEGGGTLPRGAGRPCASEDHDSAAAAELAPHPVGGFDAGFGGPPGGGAGKASRVTCLALAPGPARLWAGTSDGVVHCWSLDDDGGVARLLHSWLAHNGKIKALAVSPAGRLFTGSANGAVKLWSYGSPAAFTDPGPPRQLRQLRKVDARSGVPSNPHRKVVAMAVTTSGRLLWTAGKSTISLWSAYNGQYLGSMSDEPQPDLPYAAFAAAAAAHGGAGGGLPGAAPAAAPDFSPAAGLPAGRIEALFREPCAELMAEADSVADQETDVAAAVLNTAVKGVEKASKLFNKLGNKLASTLEKMDRAGAGSGELDAHHGGGGSFGSGLGAGAARGVAGAAGSAAAPRGRGGDKAEAWGDIKRVAAAADGSVWVSYKAGLLERFSEAGRLLWSSSDAGAGGGAGGFAPGEVTALAAVGGDVWVGDRRGDVWVLDGASGALRRSWRAHVFPVRSIAGGGHLVFTLGQAGSVRAWPAAAPRPDVVAAWRAELPACLQEQRLQVLVGTWNVNETKPSRPGVQMWLAERARHAQLVMLGLQEVEMGTTSVMGDAVSSFMHKARLEAGTAAAQAWAAAVGEVLRGAGDFRRVALRQMSGVLVLVFARAELEPHIGEVATASVACGVMGVGGNKGGVAVSFTIFRRRVVVVSSHFAAHQDKVEARNADYAKIVRHLHFHNVPSAAPAKAAALEASSDVVLPGGGSVGAGLDAAGGGAPAGGGGAWGAGMRDAELLVWVGDFNYRIDAPAGFAPDTSDPEGNPVAAQLYQYVHAKISAGDVPSLLAGDQCLRETARGAVFHGLAEGPIAFLPTYKFEKGRESNALQPYYDQGEKRRVPAWTDRVFFRGSAPQRSALAPNPGAAPGDVRASLSGGAGGYTSLMAVNDSDHKPVVAALDVTLPWHQQQARRGASLAALWRLAAAAGAAGGGGGGGGALTLRVSHGQLALPGAAEPCVLEVSNPCRTGACAFAVMGPAPGCALPTWLEVAPAAGVLPPGGSARVSVRGSKAQWGRGGAVELRVVGCRAAAALNRHLPGQAPRSAQGAPDRAVRAGAPQDRQTGARVGSAAGSMRRRSWPALLAGLALVLLGASGGAAQSCLPLTAEFVLTGLSNPDGNSRNHEVGVCLPQFTLEVTPACKLTIKPKFAPNAFVSLLQVGEPQAGAPVIPRATDSIAAINDAVTNKLGYYYLDPMRCPSQYTSTIKGNRLLASDVAGLLQKTLGVDASVLTAVLFTQYGMTIAWKTQGDTANELAYTAIAKTGGPSMPDFAAFSGSTNNFCPLLDINPAPDFDVNPQDGIVDAASATLVGRVPREIPGRPGYFVCAIAPAGGYVKVRKSGGGFANMAIAFAYTTEPPNAYVTCGPGGFLYKLGAINAAGDPGTDVCVACLRGSFANSGASLCQPCAAGSYQDQMGQKACWPCQYGYAGHEGAQRCMACFYGRPYCSEGFSANENLYTCNSARLPSGYTPEGGYSIVRPFTEPTNVDAARLYSPMFNACTVTPAETLIGFNVSAECSVQMYVMGDLGRDGNMCSANAALNSLAAHYTAPNVLAGLGSKDGKLTNSVFGSLGPAGFSTTIFATSHKSQIPADKALPTNTLLGLTYTGWGYLGGGDNGLGQNAGVRGVASDPCPAGSTKQMLNGDGVSTPGEDPNLLLSDYCVPCGPGVFCDEATSATAQNCPAGTYGALIGAKTSAGCIECSVGTYQDMDGQFECAPCPVNTFASAPGATKCMSCGDGFEVSSAGSNMCNACPAGKFRDAALSDSCQECPAGTSSGEGSSQCSVCLPGSYSASPKSAVCTECARGTSQSRYGQTSCAACTKGTYQDARAAAKCKVCPTGTFNPIDGAVAVSACRKCPPGKAGPKPGAGACEDCNPGYYTNRDGQASCTPCAMGYFAATKGSNECAPCPKGSFTEKPGSKACMACAIGFYSSSEGASRCSSCPPGSFTNSTGATKCAQCPPGTYSTRNAADSVITCVDCPPGSFSYMAGSTECMACPPGQYTPASRSQACLDCPLGTYSTADGSSRCLPCKAGFTTASTGADSAGGCSVKILLNGAPAPVGAGQPPTTRAAAQRRAMLLLRRAGIASARPVQRSGGSVAPAPRPGARRAVSASAGINLAEFPQEVLLAGGAAVAAVLGLVGYVAANPQGGDMAGAPDGAAAAGEAAPAPLPRENAVLVFGATGKLGRLVVDKLVRSGRTVVAAVRSADKAGEAWAAAGLAEGRQPGGCAGILITAPGVDVTDPATLAAGLFEGVSQVVYALGPVTGRLPEGGFGFLDGMSPERVEAQGMANILAAIAAHAPGLTAASAPRAESVLRMTSADELAAWERLDDVIMGGSSSSGLAPAEDFEGAVWRGDLIVEGGGFCGARTKGLGLDLSAYDGLQLRVKGDGQIFKFNVKTADQEAVPESTYQTTFETSPEGDWTTVRLPWHSFVPVKRAQSDPEGEPLDASAISKLGLVLSRFEFNKAPNPAYRPGPFTLCIAGGISAYAAPRPAVVAISSAGVERNAIIGDDAAARKADIPIVQLNPGGVLNWKYEAEAALRGSGLPYTIIRCTGLDDKGIEGPALLEADQGDTISGKVSRAEAADAVAAALCRPDAAWKTLELRRSEAADAQGKGMTPARFNRLFLKLALDRNRWRVGLAPFPKPVPPPPPPSEARTQEILADPRVQAVKVRESAARPGGEAQAQEQQQPAEEEGEQEPCDDADVAPGAEVYVKLRSERDTGRGVVAEVAAASGGSSGAPAAAGSSAGPAAAGSSAGPAAGPWACPGRLLVRYHSTGTTAHVRRERLVPVFDARPDAPLVLVCADTESYRCLARSQLCRADAVLELGCSYGVCTAQLAQHAGQVVGVDCGSEVVAEARRRHPHVRFEVADALEQPAELLAIARSMRQRAGCSCCSDSAAAKGRASSCSSCGAPGSAAGGSGGASVVMADIGGDRQLDALLRLVPWVMAQLAPRLLVVKSEELAAAVAAQLAEQLLAEQLAGQGEPAAGEPAQQQELEQQQAGAQQPVEDGVQQLAARLAAAAVVAPPPPPRAQQQQQSQQEPQHQQHQLGVPPPAAGEVRDPAAWWAALEAWRGVNPVLRSGRAERWFLAARGGGWRRNPLRLPQRHTAAGVRICRPHNYDAADGCRKRATCAFDHDHCHHCGAPGHRALDCPITA